MDNGELERLKNELYILQMQLEINILNAKTEYNMKNLKNKLDEIKEVF